MILNVTNGTAAIEALKRAGISGVFLPWDDVLFEGPVPLVHTETELIQIRARYIESQGWSNFETVYRAFESRNETLTSGRFQEIRLWFEHDLYDQLQLLQVLSLLVGRHPAVWLVQTDTYLTSLDSEELRRAEQSAIRLKITSIELATRVWTDFRKPTPKKLVSWLGRKLPELKHIGSALGRLVAEFPSLDNGLSQTERYMLELLHEEVLTPVYLFRKYGQCEVARFMGDSSFWGILRRLAAGPNALVQRVSGGPCVVPVPVEPGMPFLAEKLEISSIGRQVRSGDMDAVEVLGLDRWIGGTHLTTENDWRWKESSQEFTLRAS